MKRYDLERGRRVAILSPGGYRSPVAQRLILTRLPVRQIRGLPQPEPYPLWPRRVLRTKL